MLFHLKAELSPPSFKIMLLSEDVKLKFYYTFIETYSKSKVEQKAVTPIKKRYDRKQQTRKMKNGVPFKLEQICVLE